MTALPLDTRIALLREHGSFSQAYSATFQAGLHHFGDTGGFLAYKMVGSTALVLSDPLTSPENVGELIGRFLAEHSDVGFWQVSRPVAETLAPRGFFINEIGQDHRIDLADYTFNGREKRNLRNALNRVIKSGHIIREASIGEVGEDQIKIVSKAWRRRHTVRNREVAFLSRPLVFGAELDVRTVFTFDPNGTLVAFAVYDPIYECGEVVGYTAQHSRHRPDADALVQTAMRQFSIQKFQAEGKKWLFLGLSPFAPTEDKDFLAHRNWLMQRSFVWAYKSWLFNRYMYPLKAIHAHKSQFRGQLIQTYYAFNRTPSLPRLIKVLRACEIV